MGSTFDYTYAERQRDVVSGLYNFLYLPDVIDDLEVTIGDEDTEVITVTCALVDPAGENIARRMVLRMVLFTDDTYSDVINAALAGITIAATTGVVLPAELSFNGEVGVDTFVMTDENGDLVLTLTDAGAGTGTAALGFFLPSGQFVAGGEFLFAA
jgi:hypothetical protein